MAVKIKKKEGLKLHDGRARLIVTDPETGKIVKIIKSKNLVTRIGKEFVGDMLIDFDAAHDTGLTFCAIGTSNAIPRDDNDRLGVEVRRKAITRRTRRDTEIICITFFNRAESAFAIEEAGIFGHASATLAANTGRLLSRWLIKYDNRPGNHDLTFEHALRIT